MADDLVEHLRDADANSQQRIWGSRIFGEAADRIEAQEREIAELRAQRDEARLSAQTIGDELGNVIERLQRLLDEARKKHFEEAAQIADLIADEDACHIDGEVWIAGRISTAIRAAAIRQRGDVDA